MMDTKELTPARDAGVAPLARERAASFFGNERVRLTFASFLMLFVELALIRWVTANNVYVTEATNFMLLASFLGIGIGFLNSRSDRDFLRWTPITLLALVGFVLAFPVILHSPSGPTPFRGVGNMPALPQPFSFAVVFGLTVAVMAGFGQAVGRVFGQFSPLSAYRLDIAGSIAGIVAFSVLSFLDQPPVTWGVIAVGGLLVLMASRRWWQLLAVGGTVALLAFESVAAGQSWSPYNKLSVIKTGGAHPALYVSANNVPFQAAHPVSVLRSHTPFYFYPYRHLGRAPLDRVLIIGAGTGNDVAVALAEGARHVDAVKIDPQLVQLGRTSHPNHPYANPRVTVHVTDGRQFLEDSGTHYNLILYALPDSLTALAGQTAIRLESYLLTTQALAAAKAHLAPGGVFAMYNFYAPFVFNRYATTIDSVFGRSPCAEQAGRVLGRRMEVLTDRSGGAVSGCTSFWHGTRVTPSTDDRPFPYLPSGSIPNNYLVMLGAILVAAVALTRLAGGRLSGMRSYLDLGFMGAAFLLLETKNIVQFALLFGTTWFVNSLVFAGVLVAVYLAVETANRTKLPRPAVLYGLLLATLVLTWIVPEDSLLGLPIVLRFLAASALAFAPIFVANLVFAQRFASVSTSTTAFAVNLLGAVVGGTLEYLSLITGYRFLLVLAALLYGVAFVARPRQGRAAQVA